MRTGLLSLVLLCAAAGVEGVELTPHERILPIPSGPRIRIDVPPGYSFETERNPEGITLVKMENPVWEIQVQVLVYADPNRANTTAEWQQNKVITFVADALSIAAEKDYNFKPLYPRKGSGTYVVFTDPRVLRREPLPPGESANLTGGVKAWNGLTIVFQILSNGVDSEEYREVMRMFTHSFEKR